MVPGNHESNTLPLPRSSGVRLRPACGRRTRACRPWRRLPLRPAAVALAQRQPVRVTHVGSIFLAYTFRWVRPRDELGIDPCKRALPWPLARAPTAARRASPPLPPGGTRARGGPAARGAQSTGPTQRSRVKRSEFRNSPQVGPRRRGSVLAHDHQDIEAPACLGEVVEGVPGDETARAVARSSPDHLPSFQVERDILGRPPCVRTLLMDMRMSVARNPFSAGVGQPGDSTTRPGLVPERIGGDRQDLAGIHKVGSQVARRPIPPRRQGHAVAMTPVGYVCAPASRLELRRNRPGGATPGGQDRGDQPTRQPTRLHSPITVAPEGEVPHRWAGARRARPSPSSSL